MRRTRMTTCAFVLLLGDAARAFAQDLPDDGERARILFEQANQAADQERFADARRLFEESLAVLPRPATAFILALVLRSVGALRDAERRLVALEAASYGAVPEQLIRAVADLLVQVRAEIATLEVTVIGVAEASVRVDADEPLAVRAARPGRFRIDPGPHLVIARGPDGRSMDRAVRAAAGERLAITFTFAAARSPRVASPRDEGSNLAWLGWTAGAVAGAVAIVVVILIVTGSPSRESLTDPVWGRATALTP